MSFKAITLGLAFTLVALLAVLVLTAQGLSPGADALAVALRR